MPTVIIVVAELEGRVEEMTLVLDGRAEDTVLVRVCILVTTALVVVSFNREGRVVE